MTFFHALRRRSQSVAFAFGFLAAASTFNLPAGKAQGLAGCCLSDTETELLLKSYEDPLAKAAGLDPDAIRIFLVNDNSANAFVAEGQNLFMHSGMILFARTPNDLIGVMAHETGHIAGGHLSRGGDAIAKASIPMMASLLLGVGAMIAGAGMAGMAMVLGGQEIAQHQFNEFSTAQESVTDQMAIRFLNATKQSGRGMMSTFERFADELARSGVTLKNYSTSHPMGRNRVAQIEQMVNASPYADVKDSDEAVRKFTMMQAKLAGFVLPVREVFNRYPLSNVSAQARYARAMAYMRQPDLPKAISEINSLIVEEPNNPYFYEVLGQIHVSMGKPRDGIPAFQKSVSVMPTAPQLRVGLASAQLATEDSTMAEAALSNLKAAIHIKDDDPYAWYQTAKAYYMLKNEPMADLSGAESAYAAGAYPQALQRAQRALRGLPQGSPDWQRASDIVAVSNSQIRQRRQ